MRQTYASVLTAIRSRRTSVIGALLGLTQGQTPARYAHLADNPLQEATNRADALLSALASKQRAEITALKKRKGSPLWLAALARRRATGVVLDRPTPIATAVTKYLAERHKT